MSQSPTISSTPVEPQKVVIAADSEKPRKSKNSSTCKDCRQLRPENRFDDKTRKMAKSDWFCIDCGVKSRYKRGERIECMGESGVFCRACEKYKRGSDSAPETSGQYCRRCDREEGFAEKRSQLKNDSSVLRNGRRRVEGSPKYDPSKEDPQSGNELNQRNEELKADRRKLKSDERRMRKKKS